jgi:hypothetical protein
MFCENYFRKLILLVAATGAALLMTACDTVEVMTVPYVAGPTAPTTADVPVTVDNFAKADVVYFKVKAYSSFGTGETAREFVSAPSAEKSVVLAGCTTGCTVRLAWDANTEPAVNRDGGGYRIYYSDSQNFTIK